MGSMHKQILHIHTHISLISQETPLYLATADCELLGNAGFHWEVLWSHISIAVASVAEVMGQSCRSYRAELWRRRLKKSVMCLTFISATSSATETVRNTKNAPFCPRPSAKTLSSELTYTRSLAIHTDFKLTGLGSLVCNSMAKAWRDQRPDLIPVVSKDSYPPHSEQKILLHYPIKCQQADVWIERGEKERKKGVGERFHTFLEAALVT